MTSENDVWLFFVVTNYKLPIAVLPQPNPCGSLDPSRMHIPVIQHGEVHVESHAFYTTHPAAPGERQPQPISWWTPIDHPKHCLAVLSYMHKHTLSHSLMLTQNYPQRMHYLEAKNSWKELSFTHTQAGTHTHTHPASSTFDTLWTPTHSLLPQCRWTSSHIWSFIAKVLLPSYESNLFDSSYRAEHRSRKHCLFFLSLYMNYFSIVTKISHDLWSPSSSFHSFDITQSSYYLTT